MSSSPSVFQDHPRRDAWSEGLPDPALGLSLWLRLAVLVGTFEQMTVKPRLLALSH